ncbi:MAG TPA: hypothetical protein VD908_20280 [Cytophagales bacterium]|nr:hypothetical protein [Cytophagales bacterium]
MSFLKRSPLVLVVALLTINMSCQKDLVFPEGSNKELLNKWEWIRSSGGFAGKVITPVSEGYSKTIEFSSKGIYKEFRNGKQVKKINFEIREGKSMFGQSKAFIIKFENEELINQSFLIREDTLFLNEEVYDGFGHIFLKEDSNSND